MGNQVALFNAPGPQGPPGAKGPKGDAGPAGPAGSALAVSGTGFVHWSGTGADASARAVNLASNGANGDISGKLSIANLAGGTDGQILQTSGTTALWASLAASNLTPGTSGQVLITSGTVSTWTSLISVETTHGRFTAGNGGTSDWFAQIGPLPGFETTNASVYLLPHNGTPGVNNYAIQSSVNGTGFNDQAGAALQFLLGGTNTIAYLTSANVLFGATTTGTAKAQVELVHGRGVFGVGGTDLAVSIGPSPVAPTTTGGIYFNATGATAPCSLYSDGSNIFLQSFGGWVLAWTSGSLQSTQGSVFIGTVGNASWTTTLQAGNAASVMQFAAGTQNSVALGANLATAGHGRVASGFQLLARNAGNTANNTLLSDDGGNNLNIGQSTYSTINVSASTQVFLVAGSTITIESGVDMYLDANTLHLRNGAHTEYMVMTPGASATIRGDATNCTSLAVGTNKAAASLLLQGDAASTIITLTTVAEFATSAIFDPVIAPSAPGSNKVTLYSDNSDGSLYGIDSAGNIYSLVA